MTSVEATDDRTVVMKVKKPTPIMLHLYVYILPEHIWKDIDGKEVKSFANEPGPDGTVGSGPFTVVEHKKGQFIRLEANKNYYKGAPHIDELVFRVFQNQDSLAQALRRGEIDFADSLNANVFDSLKGAEGVKTFPATYSGFDEIAFNTGAALDDGTPIGDGHPALKDVKLRQALSLRDRHPDPGRPGARRLRQPGQQRDPAALRVAALRPGRDGVHLRPGEGQDAARRGGLHRGAGRHPHDAERRAEAVVPAVRPRQLADQPAVGAVRGRLAGGRRHRGQAEDRVRGRADRDHRRGQLRPVRVGLGRRAGPELPAVDVHLRQPLVQGRRQRLRRTSPTRSTATRSTTPSTRSRPSRSTRRSARRPSRRCRRCSTTRPPTS